MTAAKLVGTNGHVLAIDISTQMLSIAKQRAASLGLQDIIEFKESDAENMDLTNSFFFDAVLCRWGIMLFPNLDTALSMIHRCLISGGRFSAAVWSDPLSPNYQFGFPNHKRATANTSSPT
jgi:enediyne biosynthesis protein CalE5